MSSHHYHIEFEDSSYCVICEEGTIVQFESMEDAVEAMREFEHKSFPDEWDRVPPATRYAKQMYYSS
ncbi:hypothetical protein [Hydrogenovibrio kuenenii]|uniref:hypothetical protein n=1 Tax=Hydrogenovibrio kuenenii TaxID=63658 RepID=UPI000462F027|nr:hypothetical protein [Hydrogenovibrio kuenenii]